MAAAVASGVVSCRLSHVQLIFFIELWILIVLVGYPLIILVSANVPFGLLVLADEAGLSDLTVWLLVRRGGASRNRSRRI